MSPTQHPIEETTTAADATPQPAIPAAPASRQMPCPQCGHAMPDLKGGKASICTNCGYKDSCCY